MVRVKERTEDKVVLELNEEEWNLLGDLAGVAISHDSKSMKGKILELMEE